MENLKKVLKEIRNTFINKIKLCSVESKIKQVVNRIYSNLLTNDNHKI